MKVAPLQRQWRMHTVGGKLARATTAGKVALRLKDDNTYRSRSCARTTIVSGKFMAQSVRKIHGAGKSDKACRIAAAA